MLLCVACCATLDTPRPTSSEKVEAPPTSFSCGHAVCGACVRKRPSLGRSCIACSTVDDVLGRPVSSSSSKKGSSTAAPLSLNNPSNAPPAYGDDDFVLGGDSDDEDDEPKTPPSSLSVEQEERPPLYEEDGTTPQLDEKRKDQQTTLHYIRPEETLAGLAMRYGVEGHVLCTLNKLPISTLSTTPHLLHTLPFLLLPPGSRTSTSTSPILPAPLERRRLIVRRFQVATKCADWALAQAYCDQVFKAREEEARFVNENRRARREVGEEVKAREGGELEEAVEAFEKDERWEREQKNGLGKEKGVAMRSRLRSTGQVEPKVRKGWALW
ncbi:hypothetical protein JCM8547_000398 [Rhodosporidiobolus lusitaniae]